MLILNMFRPHTVTTGLEDTMQNNNVSWSCDDSSVLMSICASRLHKAGFSLLIMFAFMLQKQSVSRDVSGHLKREYRAKG